MIINDREDDTMKFIKYPSLTNHYAVQSKRCIDLNKECIATEKIHGSNISIIVDKERNIDVAKRSDFLTEQERTVAPWKTLAEYVDTNRELILNWFDKVCEHASKVATVEQVSFYGELFGASTVKGAGDYDITLLGERTIRFFDIHVLFTDNRRLVLSQEQIANIVGEDKTAPVLREGVLRDLLVSATELTSKFGKCIAEGQVYKPKDEYILTPDALGHVNYPVVKHKYDEWLEKRNFGEWSHYVDYTFDELFKVRAENPGPELATYQTSYGLDNVHNPYSSTYNSYYRKWTFEVNEERIAQERQKRIKQSDYKNMR